MKSNGKHYIFLRLSIITLSINLIIGVCYVKTANAQEICDEMPIKAKYRRFDGSGLKNKKLGPVSSAAISQNGKIVVVGTTSNESSLSAKKLEQNLVILDTPEFNSSISDSYFSIRKEISIEKDISSIAFHPSDRYFAVAFQTNSNIDIFDVDNLKRKPFTIPAPQIRSGKIGFSRDGATLFSLDVQKKSNSLLSQIKDNNIILYKFSSDPINLKFLKEIQTIRSESKNYSDVIFHPDGQHLIIGGDNRDSEFIEVYSIGDKKSSVKNSTRSKTSSKRGILALSISQDGKYISSVNKSNPREVIVWNSTDLSNLSIQKIIPTYWPVLSTAFSPNSQYLLVGEEAITLGSKCDSPINMWSLAGEGRRRLSLKYDEKKEEKKSQQARLVLFSPDKKSMFFGSNDSFFDYFKLDQEGQNTINK